MLISGVQQSESAVSIYISPCISSLSVAVAPCMLISAAAKLLQSCLTLCDPMDCSLLGSSVPEILQARILEWVAVSSPVHESEK